MCTELKRRFGEKADPILEEFDNGTSTKTYNLKNMDYDMSMFISGSFNSDVYPKICDWIHNNRKLFGKTILEIGCDVGVITSFLAAEFPDSKIVAIDRNRNAVEYAKVNCEKMGVNNVKFIFTDANDLSGHEFDTVFSVRTVHENTDFEEGPLEFIPMSRRISAATRDYCNSLKKLMKIDGNIVSIERMGMDPFFMGYIDAMSNLGLRGNPRTHKELVCNNIGLPIHLQTISFTLSCEPVESIDIFCDCLIHHLDTHQPEYTGYSAIIMFGLTYNEIITGYEIRHLPSGSICRYAIATHLHDPTCIMTYSNVYEEEYLAYYDTSEKERLVEELEGMIRPLKQLSHIEVSKLDSDFAK